MSSSSSARSQTARKSASLTRAVSTLPYFRTFVIFLILRILRRLDMVEAWATSFLRGAGYPPHGASRRVPASRCARRHGPSPCVIGDGAGRRVAGRRLCRHLSRVYEIGYLLETAQAPRRGSCAGSTCLRGALPPSRRSLRAPACPARSAGFFPPSTRSA